jgi:hypothetical protein
MVLPCRTAVGVLRRLIGRKPSRRAVAGLGYPVVRAGLRAILERAADVGSNPNLLRLFVGTAPSFLPTFRSVVPNGGLNHADEWIEGGCAFRSC